jgi:cob(I)alamin adenosyltransferase
MVHLSKIYTRSGDDGSTGLGSGERVRKDGPRVTAYGEVDELNAVFGLLASYCSDYIEMPLIRTIQNELFDLGADLCVPIAADEVPERMLRITPGQVAALERAIDRVNGPLPALNSFVLPGGTPVAAWLHLARTVCRRAERAVVTLTNEEAINPQALHYLNRLSDLCFVLSRAANGPAGEVLWVPGKSRT